MTNLDSPAKKEKEKKKNIWKSKKPKGRKARVEQPSFKSDLCYPLLLPPPPLASTTQILLPYLLPLPTLSPALLRLESITAMLYDSYCRIQNLGGALQAIYPDR